MKFNLTVQSRLLTSLVQENTFVCVPALPAQTITPPTLKVTAAGDLGTLIT